MSSSIIGLDLGTYSVKLVELERTGKFFTFVRALEAKIPQDPRVSREEAQSLVVEEQFSPERPPEKKTLVCAYPGHLTSIRILEMPISERKKLDKMIPFEIENLVPVDLQNIHYDWDFLELSTVGEKKGTKIFAVTVYQEQFTKFLNSLKLIQLEPREVTVDSFALANLFYSDPNHPPVALLDCGHTKSNICIVVAGNPIYCRSIGIAGREITRALEKDFNLSFLEAETLKQTDGLLVTRSGPGVSPDQERLSKSIRRAVDELAAEIRQTLINCEETHGISVEEIHLFGGSARLKNLAPYLSASVNVPVKRLNYFTPFSITEFSDEQAYSLQTAFALAIRGVQNKPHQRINLRKGLFRSQQAFQTGDFPVKQVATWVMFLFVFLLLHFMGKNFILSARLKSLDREIEKQMKTVIPDFRYQGSRQAASILKQKLSGNAPDASPYAKIAQGKSPVVLLGELSQNIPKDIPVTLTDINIDFRTMILEGTTDSRDSIGRLRENLARAPVFHKVSEDRVTKGGKGFEFKLSISLAEGEES